MKRFFSGLAALGGGLWWFLTNSWEYLPTSLQAWWRLGPAIALLAPALLILALVGLSAHFRYNDHSVYAARQAEKAPPQQKRRLDILTEQNYGLVASLPIDTGTNLFVVAKEPNFTNGLLVRDIAAVAPEGDARMKVAVIYDKSSWTIGSFTTFDRPGTNPLEIEAVLRDEPIQATVTSASEVYCFGLASSEKAPDSITDNEALAQRRGEKLCEVLAELGYVDVDRQRVFAVPLGVAIDEAKSKEVGRAQRAAIVLGVQQSYVGVKLRHYVQALTAGTKLTSVALNRYARKNNDFASEQLMWVNNDGVRSYHWRRYTAEMQERGSSIWWDRPN